LATSGHETSDSTTRALPGAGHRKISPAGARDGRPWRVRPWRTWRYRGSAIVVVAVDRILHGIDGLARLFLHLAGGLIAAPLALEVLVAGQAPGRFLDAALRLVGLAITPRISSSARCESLRAQSKDHAGRVGAAAQRSGRRAPLATALSTFIGLRSASMLATFSGS
jgi:hypothetical protein